MFEAFDRKLRHVRLRCSLNLLVRTTGRILAAAGCVAVLLIAARQLLGVDLITRTGIYVFSGATAFWAIALWLINQPSRVQASILLDERLRLRERFSTTLAFADSEDPFARAARKEAKNRAEKLQVAGHFPIRPSKCWIYALSAWLLAGAILLMEPRDLLHR